jgi:DNA-binding transcriptional MerR regulator
MVYRKSKKSDIPDGVGLLISDVVETVRLKGYPINAQQIREYENRDRLFSSIRTSGNYREYTSDLVDKIIFIRRLELADFSKKRIKEFFSLREQIKAHPAIVVNQEWDETIKEAVFVSKLSVEARQGSTEYLRIQILIKRYIAFCEEIKERFESIKKIMDEGIKDIVSCKNGVERILR